MASRSPLQISDLIKHYKITEEQLEEECSDKHLATLALSKWFFWKDWVMQLGLSDQQIEDIESMRMEEAGKAQKVLSIWQDVNGFLATYVNLIEIFLEGGNAKLAGEVCGLLNGPRSNKGKYYLGLCWELQDKLLFILLHLPCKSASIAMLSLV